MGAYIADSGFAPPALSPRATFFSIKLAYLGATESLCTLQPCTIGPRNLHKTVITSLAGQRGLQPGKYWLESVSGKQLTRHRWLAVLAWGPPPRNQGLPVL